MHDFHTANAWLPHSKCMTSTQQMHDFHTANAWLPHSKWMVWEQSDAADSLEVPAGGGRVQHRELQFLVRADDEDGPAGERQPRPRPLVGVHHAQGHRQGPALVGDDRVGEVGEFVVAFDVLPQKLINFKLFSRIKKSRNHSIG